MLACLKQGLDLISTSTGQSDNIAPFKRTNMKLDKPILTCLHEVFLHKSQILFCTFLPYGKEAHVQKAAHFLLSINLSH